MVYCGISRTDRSHQGARIFSSTGLAPLSPRAVDLGSGLHVLGVAQDTRHLLHGIVTQMRLAEYDGPGRLNMEDFGGYVTTTPAVISRGPGRIDVFARGGDGRLWWRTCDENPGGLGWGGNWTRVDGNVEIGINSQIPVTP